MNADCRAEVRPLDHAAMGGGEQLQTLEHRIGTLHCHSGPQAHPRLARRVQRVLGRLRVCARQSARAEQHAAEIARDHADNVFHTLALKDVEHRLSGCALRLTVVAVAHYTAVMEHITPAVVARVIIFLPHLIEKSACLRLRFHTTDMAEKAGALLRKLCLTRIHGDIVALRCAQSSQSSFGSV